jgi:hypothetical protein
MKGKIMGKPGDEERMAIVDHADYQADVMADKLAGCGERTERSTNAVWERRMANLLDTVENPATIPEGAPGSLHRRAWKLGRRLRNGLGDEETKR